MRFENDGISLWFEPGSDMRGETVEAGTKVSVTVGVEPADASNRVEVHYRVNQGPTEKVTADPVRHAGNAQYFRAYLPTSAFRASDTVEYTVICRCAGRQVPPLEEAKHFASSFRVIDVAAKPTQYLALKETPSSKSGIEPGPHRSASSPAQVVSKSMTPSPESSELMATRRPERNDREHPVSYDVRDVIPPESPKLGAGTIRGLSNEVTRKLSSVGVLTLADLRRMKIDKVAQETGLSSQELSRYRAAAKLQAIGISPDVAYALVRLGNIQSPAELGLTSKEKLEKLIQSALNEGLISKKEASDTDLPNRLISAGFGVLTKYLNVPANGGGVVAEPIPNVCLDSCSEELSVLGCYAYQLALVDLTGLPWFALNGTFKQDFLATSDVPVRRIDISIQVLERAIREDLGNPLRLDNDWHEYDEALNSSFVGILVQFTGKSESELASEHPNVFDTAWRLVDRNSDLDALLHDPGFNNDTLINVLKERTEKSEADLANVYPQAFDATRSLQDRNTELEKILNLSGPAASSDKAKAELASLYLKALIAQSGKTPAQLRSKYFMSFSPSDCSGTTTCRQAILTLQEYLAEKAYTDSRYKYDPYDQWRIEQAKRYYPENSYTHEFKVPLISGDRSRPIQRRLLPLPAADRRPGDRQLLRQHLDQARTILDNVRVSEGGVPPPLSDDPNARLNSFRWRPYYENMKAGLDLLKEYYEVDDLMVKGHEAFFSEEYQQARQYYLEAAEKIRLTSKRISQAMGDIPRPLWAPEGEASYLNQTPDTARNGAWDYVTKLMASYADTNQPGIGLARGQVALRGVDEQGTFLPMRLPQAYDWDERDEWRNRLRENGWTPIDYSGRSIGYAVNEQGRLFQAVGGLAPNSAPNVLVYTDRNWTDFAVELDTYLSKVRIYLPPNADVQEYSNDGLIALRYQPDQFYTVGISASGTQTVTGISQNGVQDVGRRNFTFQEGLYRIRAELRGQTLRATFQLFQNNRWDPVGAFPESESQPGIDLSDLPAEGAIALGSRFWGTHARIAVTDLSAAQGAFSDLALFLAPPGSRVILWDFAGAYSTRRYTPADKNRMSNFLKSLPTKISISYDEGDWIVKPHVGGEFFDPFYEPGGRVNGLWYGSGEDRLDREKLRRLLDGLPFLFPHRYFFLLPVCLGDVASALGQFDEALQWYRMIYDERRPSNQRGIYPWLNTKVEGEMMRLRIAKNYVDWADFLFNQDTEESLNEARMRYRQALHNLETQFCCEQEQALNFRLHELSRDLVSKRALPAHLLSQTYRTLVELANEPGNQEGTMSLIEELGQIAMGEQANVIPTRIANLLAVRVPAIRAQQPLSSIVEREKTLPERLAKIEDFYPNVLDDIEVGFGIYRALATWSASEHGTNPLPAARPSLSARPTAAMLVPRPSEASSFGSVSVPAVRAAIVPLEAFADAEFRALYKKFGPMLRFPGTLVPELPVPILPPPGVIGGTIAIPTPGRYNLCIPRNPVADALTRRACLGIRHIDLCFNALGFPQDDLSVYRFESLHSIAKNFAQMALAAEKDFIQFKDQFEKDTFELMNAAQAVALAQAGVRLAQLKVNEALDQVATANLGIESVNAQIVLTQQRIDELGSFWGWFGVVVGAIAAAVSAYFTVGASAVAAAAAVGTTASASAGIGSGLVAGVTTGLGSASGLKAAQENEEEALRMQLQLLKTVQYNAAQQYLTNAIDAERSARQQARIAELEAQFAAEKAKFLATEFFNPQLWSFLAQEVKKNYRIYLTFGNIAAWLAQRALEFERGIEPRRQFATSGPDGNGSGLNIIRFDYFQPAQQGLLGADALQRDITTLENEKFLNEQRKKQITKVISLASTYPYAFAQFLETGTLPFATGLDGFDEDYPGHYQRRIRNVRLNLFGLIGQEGIKATLSCLGISNVVVKEFVEEKGQTVAKFVEKTLRRPPESISLTNPQGGGLGPIPLTAEGTMLNPFEGHGVAMQWVFEMPKYANSIDYNTITDIQILIDYTALDDSVYRQEVINRLPRRRGAVRTFSFRLDFPDALFHLKDSPLPLNMIQTRDNFTGLYTLMVETQPQDFTPNEIRRALKDVVLYIRSKGRDFSGLKVKLSDKSKLTALGMRESDLVPGSFEDAQTPPPQNSANPNYIGRWQNSQASVTDRWYIFISPDEPANDPFLKKDSNGNPILVNGHKVFDFSEMEDVIFGLSYTYESPLPQI